MLTTDETPLVAIDLKEHTEYDFEKQEYRFDFKVMGTDGLLLQEDFSNSDSTGLLLLDLELDRDIDTINVFDEEGRQVHSFQILFTEDPYTELEILSVAKLYDLSNDFEALIDLGEIIPTPGMRIRGYGMPEAEIYAYFESEIAISKTIAKDSGYFELMIPDTLEVGGHILHLVQIFPDKTISKALHYVFEYPRDDETQELGWHDMAQANLNDFLTKNVVSMVLLLMVIISILSGFIVFYFEQRKKDSRKKSKK